MYVSTENNKVRKTINLKQKQPSRGNIMFSVPIT